MLNSRWSSSWHLGSGDQWDDHRATTDSHNTELGLAVFRLEACRCAWRPARRDGKGVFHLGVQTSADENRYMACATTHVEEYGLRVAANDIFPFIASAKQHFRFPQVGTRPLCGARRGVSQSLSPSADRAAVRCGRSFN